ncbi:polysaccharide pyruvyl transferase family protein [Akkermansia sp.]|uniref:polysaccharide pyruvyl transferase family protein n=1 Tax=Akkermansia sp. TaxID=1872421 RepID=UPI0025BEE739|nr:polysaccharide pyruvyl transferase family protein [Akkermansia sp.]MCC8148071.1 polysaccharide pyruvyl transferase family protein [Akkermansia sp.]
MNSVISILLDLGEFIYKPNPGNIGDALIAVATKKLFLEYNLPFIPAHSVSPNTLSYNFVYGGGGACIPDWGCIPTLIQLFSSPQMDRVVILPSSFYGCEALLEVFDERFTVFCRDEISFNYCTCRNRKARFLLANDMAFGLNVRMFLSEEIWKTAISNSNVFLLTEEWIRKSMYTLQDGRKVLLFLRNDRESRLGISHSIRYKYRTVDLSAVHCDDWCDANLASTWSYLFLTCLDNADVILTDRLHAAIGGHLLGKEVHILDNTYRKLSSVYYYSLYRSPNVKLLSSLEEFPYWHALV